MKTIERVVITDGGALDLATAIITLAYGLPRNPGAADSLRERLGLGNAVVHSVETAFSYPNAVALVRDERGRKAIYTFDSDQETIEEGATLPELDPMNADPTADKPAGAGAAAPAQAADEIGTRDNGHGPITGDPLDPAKVAAVPAPTPPAGDPPSSAEAQTIGPADAGSLDGLGIDPREGATDLEPIEPKPAELPPAGTAGNVTGTSDVTEPAPGLAALYAGNGDGSAVLKPDPAQAATIEGVGIEPRPVTADDPLKPEPIAPEPAQLIDAEHAKLDAVALDPAAPETGTTVAQGFTGQEAPADGVVRETTIEAAPGIGAGGTQAGAGDQPAAPAQTREPNPRFDGGEAQGAGIARWQNPYPLGTTENADWAQGYDDAEKAASQTEAPKVVDHD